MEKSNVIQLPVITRLDLDPQSVLEGAVEAELTGIVICGYTKDGEEFFAASFADGGEVLWLIERLKMKLLRMPETEEPL